MPPHVASSLSAFALLLRDYDRLLEYVHPAHSNKDVYSHRTYELLLRASTEFESLAKGLALERGLVTTSGRSAMTVGDFSPIAGSLTIDQIEVQALGWVPSVLELQPLAGWAARTGPNWYRAYNWVKHNRAARFSDASLFNVTSGLAACFLLLVGARAVEVPLQGHVHLADGRIELKSPPHGFGIRVPGDWPLLR